jgi:hypothetical protein
MTVWQIALLAAASVSTFAAWRLWMRYARIYWAVQVDLLMVWGAAALAMVVWVEFGLSWL